MLNLLHEQSEQGHDEMSMKSSFIKSTCTDSQLDLSSIRFVMGKDKHYLNVFWSDLYYHDYIRISKTYWLLIYVRSIGRGSNTKNYLIT